jgi:uncharacterized NAD-dependent epimerase/dehydratase family protein
MSDRLAIYAEGLFADSHGKTAHGIIRYGDREVVAVVDSTTAGRLANEVVPFTAKPLPVVATLREAIDLGATRLVIGVAPTGGRLPPEWKAALLEALQAGLDVEAGLHDELAADPDLMAASREYGGELRDLRAVPDDLVTPTGEGARLPVTVVHTVGSDCAIGKMSVVLELVRAAREGGRRAVFVPTGQTGIGIAGWGMAVDHVVADYIAGAAEQLVIEGAERGDLLFVEGQGSLLHPAYSGVTLGLLHGSRPHAMVLAHLAGATHIWEWEDVVFPPLDELCELYERAAAPLRPARVCAIALNTQRIADDDEARAAIEAAERESGRPCDDPVRFGPGRLWEAVERELTGLEAPR